MWSPATRPPTGPKPCCCRWPAERTWQASAACDRCGLSADAPEGPWLRRPLLNFSRGDTAALCRELALPLWIDPSNGPAYARNRIRLELLPVLETLHPGAERRMADLAERLSQVQDTRQELSELALQHLQPDGLNRRGLGRLSGSSRRQLLALWLEQQGVPNCDAPCWRN